MERIKMVKSFLYELIMKKQHIRIRKEIFPFLLTFGNALFGFLSIIQSFEKNYPVAAYFLILAACMDFLDGKLARAMGTSSNLGTELDSLADAISFCLAPIILIYAWYPYKIGIFGIVSLIIYLFAGIFRLAKFNISRGKQYIHFCGLPTPVAACFIISLIIHHRWILAHQTCFILQKSNPFLFILALALLMISSIPFPSFKESSALKNRFRKKIVIMSLWIIGTLFFIYKLPFLFICVGLYIMSGVILWAKRST